MIHLLADETPLSILNALVEPATLYDPTGTRVIGHFTPTDVERGKRLYAEVAAKADLPELARRAASGEKGHSLPEVMEQIEAAAARDPGKASPKDGAAPVSSGRDGCATP